MAMSASSSSMSLGRDTTTGPGRPERATWNARAMMRGTSRGSLISMTHLAMLPRNACSDLLAGLLAPVGPGHLADEQDQRRRVVPGEVHADARVGGAGTAGDHAHSRRPGGLAVGLGHEARAALVPVGDEGDLGDVPSTRPAGRCSSRPARRRRGAPLRCVTTTRRRGLPTSCGYVGFHSTVYSRIHVHGIFRPRANAADGKNTSKLCQEFTEQDTRRSALQGVCERGSNTTV